LVTRTVGRLEPPSGSLSADAAARLEDVEELRVAGITHRGWEEAIEVDIDCGSHGVASLIAGEVVVERAYPENSILEPLVDEAGLVVGALTRTTEPLDVEVTLTADRVDGNLSRVRVVVRNAAAFRLTGEGDRERALLRSLVSTHAILVAGSGEWLSLADPPAEAAEAAAGCRNTGLWPVLAGEPGSSDTMLASPIILEDHAQVAPESSGDLFDATEIDEILSLRILALTEDEKAEMRAADGRSRALLDRTEALTGDDLIRMHGTIRAIHPASRRGR
jgi:hypothetical protein